MADRKAAKTIGLILAVVVLALEFVCNVDWSVVGICKGAQLTERLCYSLIHASLIHVAVNTWCLLSVIFIYDINWQKLAVAYLAAVFVPDLFLSVTPTVGLSTVCYSLLGMAAFQTKRKLIYNTCIAIYILMGFLFPAVNAWLHLYGYLVGLLVGVLNLPVRWRGR